jgi:hypothetical protein
MNGVWSIGGMILTGELNVAEEKPKPVTLRQLQKIRKFKFKDVTEKRILGLRIRDVFRNFNVVLPRNFRSHVYRNMDKKD